MSPVKRFIASLLLLALAVSQHAVACPFCTAEMQTISEELADADAAVIARLVKPALPTDPKPDGMAPYGAIDPETGNAEFEILKILKGEDELVGADVIEAIYFGTVDFKKQFLIRGIGDSIDATPMAWAIPLALSPLAVEYVQKLPTLPESGADRLAFFQPYLEHEDRQLAQDAYDEFARAPYADLKDLKPRIDKPRVLQMINDPLISPNRRRLFFTMLGVAAVRKTCRCSKRCSRPTRGCWSRRPRP